MFGQADFVLNTNFCSCSELGECHCVVVNASLHEVILRYHGVAHYVNFANKLLTDAGYGFDGVSVSEMSLMLKQDLEQLSCMIPNLQKLDLSQYQLCSNNVRGLRSIVHNCRNLVGLNLTNTHSQSLNPMVLWEILCSTSLTHISIEYCLVMCANADRQQKKMVNLYQNFSTVQAIEIGFSMCEVCNSLSDFLFFSHFPSLLYCRLCYYDSFNSNGFLDILTKCKQLKCLIIQPSSNNKYHKEYTQLYPYPDSNFKCYEQLPFNLKGISFSLLPCNNNLEQLFIDSDNNFIPDEFVESVSSHGGLAHVVLRVATISVKGVKTLIENSPKLVELHIGLSKPLHENNKGFDPSTFKTILMKRYCCRKLFTVGYFEIVWIMGHERMGRFFDYHYKDKEYNSVFFSLW